MVKKKRNCKHGLSNMGEIEARKMRQEILNAGNANKYYPEVKKMYDEYMSKANRHIFYFGDYVKEQNPVLWSAFTRLNINFLEFIINNMQN